MLLTKTEKKWMKIKNNFMTKSSGEDLSMVKKKFSSPISKELKMQKLRQNNF